MPKGKKPSRLSILLSDGDNNSNGVADWSCADPNGILKLIVAVGSKSGAVRFGYTRDGGAYNVGIYVDDDNATFYCRPSDDLDKFVDDLARGITNL